MAKLCKVEGVKEFVHELKKKGKKLEVGVENGLKASGLLLLGESLKICPLDTGNLRRSGRTRHSGKGFKTVVIVGYLVAYAVYVHEMVGAFFKTPGTQAKYLEEPAQYMRKILITVIRNRAMKEMMK